MRMILPALLANSFFCYAGVMFALIVIGALIEFFRGKNDKDS